MDTATPESGEAAVSANPADEKRIENSVVKIFSTKRYPDVFRPWTKQPPQEVTGSGVVIEGRRILTNSHVVLYASQVQVQASQSGDKISATVVANSPEIDLAVLELDDDSFFDTHAPLVRTSTLPEVKDTVMAYGFPTGGSSLSITKGIVSRIEFTPYIFPVSGLRIQIDAAINPGNSGGPAIVGDEMIGLAFSHLDKAQNIGYIIPNEEIELFLQDIADGKYDGKYGMFNEIQNLQNPALREYLKLDKGTEGVVLSKINTHDSAYPLHQWDVLTSIGGSAIDNEGMVKLSPTLRVQLSYMIQKTVRDGTVQVSIMRNGQEQQIDVPVTLDWPMLFTDLKGNYPSYFVFGPLVLSTVTTQMFGGFDRNGQNVLTVSGSPIIGRRSEPPAFPDEQLVVVPAPFFPHKLAKGYWPHNGRVIKSINGVTVRNLKHAVEILRDAKDEFIVIEFTDVGIEKIVFPRQEAVAATESILEDNDVRSQGSPDTLEVWHHKSRE
ncbi:MAG: trypsin-like peptidase domain-containing protein [Cephaloticoccus sp.]|nr:trypsin-like peptidase domain-containing protein [Cephaloticoccus sp.]